MMVKMIGRICPSWQRFHLVSTLEKLGLSIDQLTDSFFILIGAGLMLLQLAAGFYALTINLADRFI